MEQSPSWEANRFSAIQEIPRISWNPKVHYRIHKGPPPVPILSHLGPVLTSTSLFLKIHLIIIFLSTPESPKWSLSRSFPHQNPVYTYPLLYTCYMPRPYHSSGFDHPNNIWWGVSSPLCAFLHFPVTASLLDPNILLCTRLSDTLSLHSSLNMSDELLLLRNI